MPEPFPSPCRLLAVDLDGTLLRHDGSMLDEDRAAIDRALRSGVAVTIATGRLASGALPIARALGVDGPVICNDGGLLVCGASGRVLEQLSLGLEAVDSVFRIIDEHALHPFAFLASVIHGETACTEAHALLRSWTEHIVLHSRLAEAAVWRAEGVALAFGIGPRQSVDAAAAAVQAAHGETLDVAGFLLHGHSWGLRVRPAGCDKARLVAQLAERWGVAREDVCAVGDWYNDAALLAWAGTSFAMADSPADVRSAARHVVAAGRGQGGGVAEAIGRWLNGSPT